MRVALDLEEPRRPGPCRRAHAERSLRPRSTSITCSARSFSEASSRPRALVGPGSVVPAIGIGLGPRAPRASRASPARSRSAPCRRARAGTGTATGSPAAARGRATAVSRGWPHRAAARADLEASPARMCSFGRHDRRLVHASCETHRRRRGGAAVGRSSRRGPSAPRAAPEISSGVAEHLGDARQVVEVDERVRDHEAALRGGRRRGPGGEVSARVRAACVVPHGQPTTRRTT